MPTVQVTFDKPLNTSVQVGDMAYYCGTTSQGAYHTANSTTVRQIGKITRIDPWNGFGATIHVLWNPIPAFTTIAVFQTFVAAGDVFILFGKDNNANLTSLLGYYAEVEFKNNETNKSSELFSVGTEFFESSK
jgi:hypothetical protein